MSRGRARVLPLLHKNPALAGGAERVLGRLAEQSEARFYDKDALVVSAGGAQTHVLLIAEGSLRLYRRNREAETQILVGILEPPSIFGDAELYGHASWSVSARAASETTVVAIPNDAWDRAIADDVKIAAAMYRDASARHLLAIQIMQVLALQKTQHQILRLLWDLAPAPSPGEPRIAPLSQIDLAKAIGAHRKTVARNLKDLEDSGLIRRDEKGKVALLISEDVVFWGDLTRHGFGASWKLPVEPTPHDED